jgi:hypothetical protein
MTKDIVLKLMHESKEQALKSKDPHSYMYPVLLNLLAHTFDFSEEEAREFDGLLLQQWEQQRDSHA